MVSDLFDPRGSHGQGPLFLNELLTAIGIPPVGVRDVVRVNREVLTEKQRRIDIVVETPSVLLGIENKPWAGQQHNQLVDYRYELKRHAGAVGKPFVLVFLSDQEEKTAKGEVVRISYQPMEDRPSLHSILTSVIGTIRAERTRAFVADLIDYINVQFGEGQVIEEGDEPYVQAVVAEFESGPIRKKALATVLLSQQMLHARILNEIGDFLLSELRAKVMSDFVADKASLWESLNEKWEGFRRA